MKSQILCSLATCLSMVSLLTGCGNPAPPVLFYGAQGQNYLAIQTNVSSPSEAWPNATISGYADPNTLSNACNVLVDSNCIAAIGTPTPDAVYINGINSFNTNSNGQADFGTDAVRVSWTFYAVDNGSSQCNNGTATTVTNAGLSTGSEVSLTCGQNDSDMVATPATCTINETVTPYQSTCPTNITLTFPPPASSSYSLPLNTQLASAVYTDTGNYSSQSSAMPTNSTSIIVPRPTLGGTAYIAVNDPATGKVYGVAEFTTIVVFPPNSGPPKP